MANNNILAFQVDTLRKKMLTLDEKCAVPRRLTTFRLVRGKWATPEYKKEAEDRTKKQKKRNPIHTNPSQKKMKRFQVAKSNMATLTLCRGKDTESAFQRCKCRGCCPCVQEIAGLAIEVDAYVGVVKKACPWSS